MEEQKEVVAGSHPPHRKIESGPSLHALSQF